MAATLRRAEARMQHLEPRVGVVSGVQRPDAHWSACSEAMIITHQAVVASTYIVIIRVSPEAFPSPHG